MSTPTKYESKTQPGLFYWAEPNGGGGAGAVESFGVVAQMTGFPPTEACDDWFANEADADAMARELAGQPLPTN